MKAKRAVALTLALDALRQELARGPKGDQGGKGDRGERGLKGERGERGLKGERGEKGGKGDRGERGERGLKGEIGPRGLKGDKGDKGDRGERGISLGPTPDEIYAALLVYFKKNPVKDGESFDDVEVVRMDDGINYKLRFHHTSRGWVDGGTIRTPRPFAKGKPVMSGGGSGAEALDGSDDAMRVDVEYVSDIDGRPSRIVRDAKEARYDWGAAYQYKGVAAKDSLTSDSVWTIWRTTLDAFGRATRRDRLDGAVWNDRVSLAWPS